MLIRSKPLLLFGVVVVLFMCGNLSAATKEVGTITLKSGEVFEQVKYKVDQNFKVITMYVDELKKKVIFSDIESIVNRKGVNITRRILGWRYESSGDSWASENSVEFKKAREKKWSTALGFSLSYDFPTGDYYDGTTSGLGFGGNFHLAINHQLAIKLKVSRAGIDFSDDFGFIYPANIIVISEDFSMNATRILFGLEFYESVVRGENLRSTWYVHSMLGFISHKLSSKIVLQDIATNEIVTLIGGDTQTQFAMNVGAGIIPMISPSIGINLSADLDLVWATVFYNDGSTGADIGGYVFDFNIGLMFLL